MQEIPEQLALDADYAPLREKVRDVVRARIIDGFYSPGMRLVEQDIATQLGVSRVPLREAFRALESEGFVASVPRRGVIVSRLSERDVEELFDVREAVEALACRRAAERSTPSQLEELGRFVDEARNAIRLGDYVAFGVANEAFHDRIIELADNALLSRMVEPLQGRLHWLFRQTNRPEELCEEHQTLFEAIASRDPVRASAEALHHVQQNRLIVTRLLFDEPAQDDR